MKQPVDTVTPELHLDGQPVFDLDHDAPWPMPAGGKWEPRPEPESGPVYQYWQCQVCGAPIGVLGRFMRGLGFEFHNCNTHKYDRNR